ncbi:MAG: bifunctional D-glycero-beta-D-manno-heptose-7-phosphate kinase/D-glycero-beta-D-manno-heptose 1-phosphate adenylyltransferase HldE [Synergistetes bacterium]|nr:bifunctional D-glycero-beta-D-manno-heptose-7-phosphate kinase/D-glycero-beta-D-manno-heptose 1-phosphate adenylyltransferase HldE [Synergistota bacterium]MCX8127179.1 bifunctional D-glycero-beta-D-manno-heptose-7-phosphate kinase/D-glycero-beta-D-manno-heptose 1-phosphate adenylyltransferase HldE [Synergistota bacterium]MDW8191935.1 bifunctional D-glycero-beta-D-manno-heptose-7-phosphate kinase/D-glycero-beta-D-manno-heptose 1-phosphate adenylyltransferase HldE [Synergistota bacterium]
MDSLSPFVAKILVIGDVMLDRYYYGEVNRISPEAPVPVVRVCEEKVSPGGAGNVAVNLVNLGCKVFLAGALGEDSSGELLKKALLDKGIDVSGLILRSCPTITKVRILGGRQQVVRVDFEEVSPLKRAEEEIVLDWFLEEIRDSKCVVISDYGKGFCTTSLCRFVIEESKRFGIPVIVDPKGPDWKKYEGAFIVTPNVKELGEVYGKGVPNVDKDIEKAGFEVLYKYKLENLLVTRSEKGMTLFESGNIHHIPTKAREVFDVSGAGDTVVATLAACIATGRDLVDSARLSNIAAGVVVGKIGTAPITLSELEEALRNSSFKLSIESKIKSFDETIELVRRWKRDGFKIVFTNGCFDLLHVGHIYSLEEAKKRGDKLIVGLNSDSSVRRLKGEGRPLVPQEDRARMLAALEFVDCVVIFDEDTPEKLISLIRPDVLVKGGDYKVEEVVGREYAREVHIVPLFKGYSTTSLVRKILEGKK